MHSFPRFIAASALTSLLALAHPAAATELAGADLAVERASEAWDCPDADGLARSVLALWMAPERIRERMRITVHFARTRGGYSAEIQSAGAKSGVRKLETTATSCASLGDAVSVTLAVLLDLIPVAREGESRAPGVHRERELPPGPPFHLAASIRAGGSYGLLGPAGSAVFSASLLLSREIFGVDAQAFWATPRGFSYDRGFVDVSLWGAGLDGCFIPGSRLSRQVAWRACGGLRLGAISGAGSGYELNAAAKQLWLAFSASLQLELPLSRRLRLLAGPSLLVPMREHVFRIGGRGAAFESLPLAGVFELGPELAIW